MARQTYGKTDFGRRLIPSLIDEKAFAVPGQTYCYLPCTSTVVEDGFRAVSFKCLANAINTCAWWLETNIGTSHRLDTLAYLGPSDLRNTIIIVAAIKTGHKALLASPRNRLEAHLALLESTQCHVLLTADPPSKGAQEILSRRSMRHVIVPEVEQWLEAQMVPPYPYTRTFDEARYEPFVVVHTSGSTGLPKVVVLNHGTLAAMDAFNGCADDDECGPIVMDAIRNKCCYVSMPSFHIAGIDFMLAKALYQGVVPVLSPLGVPVTAELVDAMHQLDIVEISIVAPSILQDIASSPFFLENLGQLSATMYGGGPLSPSAGDAIISKTKLYNMMGSSEMVNVPTEEVDRQDWEYLKFSPKLGFQMRHHSGNLFELCFLREPHLDLFQSMFATFPDRQDYPTSDLYSKHPTKPDLWKYQGRADDIITLTNGEKVNPVAMEKLIEAHPAIRSVLVVGQARFQTALLVEAKEPPLCSESMEALIETLWPTIEHANTQGDSHARISRDLILFATPQKPFCRAGKGTVQRRMTLDTYHDEISKLYGILEKLAKPTELESIALKSIVEHSVDVNGVRFNEEAAETWMRTIICEVTGWSSLDINTDFFMMGMDSLQVINIVRASNAASLATGGSLYSVTASTIYSNPTVSMLANACAKTRKLSYPNNSESQVDATTNTHGMEELFSKYSWKLPITSRSPKPRSPGDIVRVLLTGSTGSLGSYILGNLLENPKVSHIYCLNRSANSEKRQQASNLARGISTGWSSDRVTFLHGDLAQEYLGLAIHTYKALLDNVTHIMHNAWEVNFNLPLASFEVPHLLGVRQFIDFSAHSAMGASILFISSISSAMRWQRDHGGLVPEDVIDDASVALPMGYAQSKYVAERLLSNASSIAGIPTTVVRVGQVAGPITTHGIGDCWNKHEWLPCLVASSKHLGKIPRSIGPNDVIDWIPVDVLSHVLVELMGVSSTVIAGCPRVNGNGHSANKYKDTTEGNGDLVTNLLDNVDRTLVNENQSATNGDTQSSSLHGIVPGDELNKYHASNGIREETVHSPNDITKRTNDEANGDKVPDHRQEHGSAAVYHAVNPNHTTWSTLLSTIQAHFHDRQMEVISIQDWITLLSASATDAQEMSVNPAIRLLDFYQSLADDGSKANPVFETRATVAESRSLKSLEAVKPEWMKMWLEQWDF
ncbi:MAG: hypothetical protein Q9166_002870 [cf. Caloplaca sp. 2 TL-2023]